VPEKQSHILAVASRLLETNTVDGMTAASLLIPEKLTIEAPV
jgi:hypothetical protein